MTKIQWTGETWNYVVGCSEISLGCRNCYAKKLAQSPRLARFPQYQAANKWDGTVVMVSNKIEIPLRRKKPRTYFVNSMSDLFHENMPEEWINLGFGIMATCKQHTFQILTKRHERMQEYLSQSKSFLAKKWYQAVYKHFGLQWQLDYPEHNKIKEQVEQAFDGLEVPLPNVWCGVSVENQSSTDAISSLIDTNAAIRFISCEPLLEKIDITPHLGWTNDRGKPLTNWVIVGGESGFGSRPCQVEWIEDLVNQCRQFDVPVFVKQLGSNSDWKTKHPQGGNIDEFPEHLQIREFPSSQNYLSCK